jgi:hypothetical protein
MVAVQQLGRAIEKPQRVSHRSTECRLAPVGKPGAKPRALRAVDILHVSAFDVARERRRHRLAPDVEMLQ